jgi:DNA-binding transcriptional ArsR family regulator
MNDRGPKYDLSNSLLEVTSGGIVIDQLQVQIQQRLDELLAEADKLRRALAALGGNHRAPVDGPASPPRPTRSRTASVRTASGRVSGASSRPRRTTRARRGPSGSTKGAILAALSKSRAMTAGDVAAATGLGRASVSTTLSKLSKTGEVTKANRGYRRA